MSSSLTVKNDTKKVFRKCGTCSRTFCYLLDREFDNLKDHEERAADPLAGGIVQKGQQCGMLWGAALAVGSESFHKHGSNPQARALAIKASHGLVESFRKRTHTVNCREITNTDFSNRWQMLTYLVFGAWRCFSLAEKWAPEAIQVAKDVLSTDHTDLPEQCVSCASEVARKMGASEEEMTMVAGFAGGLGLSGNACGALAAAIWMKSLAWSREHPGKSTWSNPGARDTLEVFNDATGGEILCHRIAGEHFITPEDHSEFIKNGGCEELINVLAED